MERKLDRKLDKKLDKKLDDLLEKKIGRKKKLDEKKWTRKKKWTEKLDGPKTKIGRNSQPHTFDFDAASNTAKRAKS